MRDPLIMLKSSDLKLILEDYNLKLSNREYLELLKKLKSKRILNRTLVFANTTIGKKISKKLRENPNNAERFNRILKTLRLDLGHKHIRTFTKDDVQYEFIKKASSIADEFIQLFEIDDIDAGYKEFISIGLNLMGKKFSVNKFNFYKEKIFNEFESIVVISEDSKSDLTKEYYNYYCNKVLKDTGFNYTLSKKTNYMHFIYTRIEAEENNASMEDWIDAQFDGLSFLSVVPELNQLYGINAKDRFNRYKLKHKKSLIAQSYELATDNKTEYIKRLREKRLK